MKYLLNTSAGSIGDVDKIMFLIAIIMGVILFAAMLFAITTKIIVAFTYRKYNKVYCQKQDSSEKLTNDNLNMLNLQNVKVKKVGLLRGLLGFNMQGYGNSYSAYKKLIYLRKNIIEKNSITAYAVSTQKVAHAEFDSKKQHQFYYRIKPFMILTPSLFIPIIILGAILDLILYQSLMYFTIISSLVSLITFITFFIILLITIPVERKANLRSEEILIKNNLVTDEELVLIKKVNKSYILSYISDFIYSLLKIVWDIFRIALKVLNSKNK